MECGDEPCEAPRSLGEGGAKQGRPRRFGSWPTCPPMRDVKNSANLRSGQDRLELKIQSPGKQKRRRRPFGSDATLQRLRPFHAPQSSKPLSLEGEVGPQGRAWHGEAEGEVG